MLSIKRQCLCIRVFVVRLIGLLHLPFIPISLRCDFCQGVSSLGRTTAGLHLTLTRYPYYFGGNSKKAYFALFS